MAARLKNFHQEEIKAKIQASQLLNLVQNHALDGTEIPPSRLESAKYLLDKLVSKAPQQTEISGPDGEEMATTLTVKFESGRE